MECAGTLIRASNEVAGKAVTYGSAFRAGDANLGGFYPRGLPHKRELALAAGIFDSVEINGTFYSLQRPESFSRWADETPYSFLLAVEGARYATQVLKLKDIKQSLANPFAAGILLLGPLGLFLWQFPPNFGFSLERLERFFEASQHDFRSAALLIRESRERA